MSVFGDLAPLPARLAGADLALTVPPRASQSHAIELALGELARDHRPIKPTDVVLAAALGLCWARVRNRVPWTGDVLAYGLAVQDLLLDPAVALQPGDEPVTSIDVLRAGMHAANLILDRLPSAQDVTRARGFSGPPSARSSASDSSSSADGGASPGGSPVSDETNKPS